MNNRNRPFKIAVLDDSKFYNTLFTHQLGKHTHTLSLESGAQIELQAFEEVQDFLDHVDRDTNMAFVDYYLDHGLTASDLLPRLRIIAPECTVIIISRSLEAKSALRSPATAAVQFMLKDEDTISKSAMVVRELLVAGSKQPEMAAQN